jgi:hypothetical protein
MAYVTVLCQHEPEGAEKSHENFQSKYLVSEWIIEPAPSRIRSTEANHSIYMISAEPLLPMPFIEPTYHPSHCT